MKGFDEWWKNWSGTNVLPENTDINYAFKAGQQSKQSEVDELQKKVKDLELINFDSELHLDAAKEHIDELRKRIDAVVEYLDGCDSCCDISKLHLIEVLQGDQS